MIGVGMWNWEGIRLWKWSSWGGDTTGLAGGIGRGEGGFGREGGFDPRFDPGKFDAFDWVGSIKRVMGLGGFGLRCVSGSGLVFLDK